MSRATLLKRLDKLEAMRPRECQIDPVILKQALDRVYGEERTEPSRRVYTVTGKDPGRGGMRPLASAIERIYGGRAT